MLIIVLAIATFFIIPIFRFLFPLECEHGKAKPEKKATKAGDVFSIWNYDGRIAFEDMIEATEDFDIKYCIGTGGYASVYRAQLPNGRAVALKKLHMMVILFLWECIGQDSQGSILMTNEPKDLDYSCLFQFGQGVCVEMHASYPEVKLKRP
ncbi:hypothetical protein Pint_19309 [Pistacia integerrima]|uniref:Uncharacterized protein n=2 Tax=Pistacia integerrima TaxID=434235 RepID=A0ACC0YZM4_9ROSI|nr:hypothetical protein Pint_19314 [Pistacia integerrima]KAJ0043255.1 hypothetical protein Pint_19309 [Pistacia integerrima]